MSHEQSETIERNGLWYNVYGQDTPQAGQVLPGTSGFKSMEEARTAAEKRSASFGKTLSFEQFSGQPDSEPESKVLSLEEFSGQKQAPKFDPSGAIAQSFDDSVNFWKSVGGETAALADLVLSFPGFVLSTGAQLGGTVQAIARGVPTTPDPRQLNPVTAYTVGREAGREFGEPLMNPLHKVLKLFRSGEAYEQATTSKGMEKLTTALEDAGRWAERTTGGRVSRDAIPMMAETLMTAVPIRLALKKPGGIDPQVQTRLRESAIKLREEAESKAQSESITLEEFQHRVPVQQQINDMLSIRRPEEQAKITRQRRQDLQQAFARRPEEGGDYGSAAESVFRAEERLSNEAALRERDARAGAEADRSTVLDTEKLPPRPERVGQAEILRIMQKPGFERTAEDLITLRKAREEGKASPEALALLSAAGIGATVGGALDDDVLRGATLGLATTIAPVSLMAMLGKRGVRSRFGQAGAVKEPGGMWHPEAVERLATPLYNKLVREARGPGYEDFARERITPEELKHPDKQVFDWSQKAIRNYLNKYAGTTRDPLRDVEIPAGEGTRPWGQMWDEAITMTTKEGSEAYSRRPTPFPEWKNVKPGETVFDITAQAAGSRMAVENYLSHAGDFARQNIKPEKLKDYDLTRLIRETYQNDLKVAKEMEKAQAASTKDLPVYKAYPDGYKWVELKLPEKLTPEMEKQVRPAKSVGEKPNVTTGDTSGVTGYVATQPDGKPVRNAYTGEMVWGRTPEEAVLAKWLAEEGNQMGHCVGGYCPSVASGESRIFSLRDEKGRSHVTIETTPTEKLISPEFRQAGDEYPTNIEQIKGKQNRAPEAKYLPYVQDFVKSGKWGEVGDLEGTGLIDIEAGRRRGMQGEYDAIRSLFPDERYITREQFREGLNKATRADSAGPSKEQGFARQELVTGLAALGLGGLSGSLIADDPLAGALLGALAGGALMMPGVKSRFKEVVEKTDYLAGNISTRIRNISPALLQRARLYEMRSLTESHRYLHQVAPFMQELQKVPATRRAELDRAILTNDRAKIAQLMQGNVPLVKAWREARNTLNELGTSLQGHGRFRAMKDDYFPRLVKDIEGLKQALDAPERTRLEKAISEAETQAMKSRGVPLSHIEISALVNREMQALGRRPRGYQPGFAKPRSVEEVTEALRPFYHTPSESLYAYVRGAVADLETAKFFGRDLAQVEKGGQRYIDLENSIGNIVGRELKEGKIDYPQAKELMDILNSRFWGGERSSARVVQDIRNLGNAGLLGNIVAGATQGADALMAVYAHTLRDTMTTMARQFTRNERVTPADFGLADHIAEEFSSTSRTANFLNKMFKYSGFAGIDRFGKSTQLNAALTKYERWSRTPGGIERIKEKYGEAYGNEFNALVGDLKRGELTERVRALLFSELSDMQPISKLELPQGYLDHPNGRLIYMLKTFMLKQMDVVRRDVLQEMEKGNIGKGLKNATEYAMVLGISGATTDMVKDWLMGRPVSFEGTDVLENVLKTFGWSEYTRAKAAQGRPIEAAIGAIAPPYRMMDDAIRMDAKAVQYIPLVGKLYYNWELGGKEEAEIRAASKAKRDTGRRVPLSPEARRFQEQRRRERARERKEAR